MRVRIHLALRSMQLRLEALSVSDALTGIANRRRFDDVLRTEWLRAVRSGTGIGAVMIDIDYFKRYNDNYGHVRGDRCLQLVARALQTVIWEDVDLAARYGGEEFILVLPGADSSATREVAERARRAVLALQEPHAASPVGHVTISVGAAALVPTDSSGAARLIEAADNALYCAKQQGRNQVIEAGALPHPIDTATQAPSMTRSSASDQLQYALLDSRQRWRDLTTMESILALRQIGRAASFIDPDPALGWPATTLLGQRAEMLLESEGSPNGFKSIPGHHACASTANLAEARGWFDYSPGSQRCPIAGPRGSGHRSTRRRYRMVGRRRLAGAGSCRSKTRPFTRIHSAAMPRYRAWARCNEGRGHDIDARCLALMVSRLLACTPISVCRN